MAIIGLSVGIASADSSSRVVQGSHNNSVYEAASNVTIQGTINGDVFCAGQTITIDAKVNGDVLCAGQNITLNGTVSGNVRLAGQTVDLNGKVTRSASIAGQSITLSSTAAVGRDLSLAGQSASVDAPVARDITGAVQTLDLSKPVGRNVLLHSNQVNLYSGAIVIGSLTYTSPHTLNQYSGAHVRGPITYHKSSAHNVSLNAGFFIGAKLYWFVALIVFSVALVALFPRLFREWNVTWGSRFWWAVLAGFVAMFVVPVVAIILAFTLIGIPLAIVLALLWIVEAFLTVPLSAYFVGSLVVPRFHPLLLVLIGVVILGIVELIPILGWIVGFAAYWLGSGMLLMGLQRHYRRPTYV